MLEKMLLRQQLIVFERQVKRLAPSWRESEQDHDPEAHLSSAQSVVSSRIAPQFTRTPLHGTLSHSKQYRQQLLAVQRVDPQHSETIAVLVGAAGCGTAPRHTQIPSVPSVQRNPQQLLCHAQSVRIPVDICTGPWYT